MKYKNMGVQENQNCTIITLRMKHRRMRWSISGANNMAKLLYRRENDELIETIISYRNYMLIDNHGIKAGETAFEGTAIRMRVPSKRIANAQAIISKIASQGEAEAKTIRNAFKTASIPSKGLMEDLQIKHS